MNIYGKESYFRIRLAVSCARAGLVTGRQSRFIYSMWAPSESRISFGRRFWPTIGSIQPIAPKAYPSSDYDHKYKQNSKTSIECISCFAKQENETHLLSTIAIQYLEKRNCGFHVQTLACKKAVRLTVGITGELRE